MSTFFNYRYFDNYKVYSGIKLCLGISCGSVFSVPKAAITRYGEEACRCTSL